MSVKIERIYQALLETYNELDELDVNVDSDALADAILEYEGNMIKALYKKGHILVQKDVGKRD